MSDSRERAVLGFMVVCLMTCVGIVASIAWRMKLDRERQCAVRERFAKTQLDTVWLYRDNCWQLPSKAEARP